MKATCYHLRSARTGLKVLGGSISSGGMNLDQAAEHLMNTLPVHVSESGHVYFTHRGSPVFAYLSVDPSETEKGRAALKAWRDDQSARLTAEQARDLERKAELDDLVGELGLAKAIRLLKEKRNEDQDK